MRKYILDLAASDVHFDAMGHATGAVGNPHPPSNPSSRAWPLGVRGPDDQSRDRMNAIAVCYERDAGDATPESTAAKLRRLHRLDEAQAKELAASLHKSWNAESRLREEHAKAFAARTLRDGHALADVAEMLCNHFQVSLSDAGNLVARIHHELERERRRFREAVAEVTLSAIADDAAVQLCRTFGEDLDATIDRIKTDEGLGEVDAMQRAIFLRDVEQTAIESARERVAARKEWTALMTTESLSAGTARVLMCDRGWPDPAPETPRTPSDSEALAAAKEREALRGSGRFPGSYPPVLR